jgi:hypothetical protein
MGSPKTTDRLPGLAVTGADGDHAAIRRRHQRVSRAVQHRALVCTFAALATLCTPGTEGVGVPFDGSMVALRAIERGHVAPTTRPMAENITMRFKAMAATTLGGAVTLPPPPPLGGLTPIPFSPQAPPPNFEPQGFPPWGDNPCGSPTEGSSTDPLPGVPLRTPPRGIAPGFPPGIPPREYPRDRPWDPHRDPLRGGPRNPHGDPPPGISPRGTPRDPHQTVTCENLPPFPTVLSRTVQDPRHAD